MSSSQASILEGIASTAGQLASHIASILRSADNQKQGNTQPVQPLYLPEVDTRLLHQALSKRSLSKALTDQIVQAIQVRIEEAKNYFASFWHELLNTTPSKFEEPVLKLLEEITQKKFLDHAKQLQLKSVAIIDGKLQKFICDAEIAASESESSSEDDLSNHRGHSRLAVAILEKAYSHTNNITRAEKSRLAAATKLQPRQVTIWFQNRRNRKTAPISKLPETPAAKLGPRQAASTSPSPPRIHKRKANDSSDEDDMLPPQRMRTSTPRGSPSSMNGSSSTPSMASSFDSLASWSRGVVAKNRNYSTESSEIEGHSIYNHKEWNGKAPNSISFDDHVQMQIRSSSFAQQAQQDDPSSALLFSDSGEALLDIDDLGLDLNSLVGDLPSFSNDAFDFSMPALSGELNQCASNVDFDILETPRQTTFAIPNRPTTAEEAADRLSLSPFDAAEEFMRAQQIEKWASGRGCVLEEDDDNGWYIGMEGLFSGGTSTPGGESTTTAGSNASTPPDIFDFSLGALSINSIMEENFATFQGVSDMSVTPQDAMSKGKMASRGNFIDSMEISKSTSAT